MTISLRKEVVSGRGEAGRPARAVGLVVNKRILNIKQEEKMKKFLVVLFALGLVAAFSLPAAAVDVKFSGYYSVWGFYDDNHSLGDGDKESLSHAFYSQRLRLNTVFQVAEGLKLTTACDIMEKMWGTEDSRHMGGEKGDVYYDVDDEQNIDFDKVYVSFDVPFGTFHVGYMPDNRYGTVFGDDIYTNLGIIRYTGATGPWTYCAYITKKQELDAYSDPDQSDADEDWYTAFVNYNWASGEAGVLYRYVNDKSESFKYRGWTVKDFGCYDLQYHVLTPYAKATFGPIYVEGQIYYVFGNDALEWSSGVDEDDMDVDSLSAYVMAKVDLQQFYVGAQIAYAQGDDDMDDDEINDLANGGSRYNPCLILWNWELNHWMGNTGNANDFGAGDEMKNAFLYQVFAGCRPIEKLHVKAALAYAEPDEKVQGNDDEYGTEFDITATYKIYDNLAYTVGFGYLWTGDYFKGVKGGGGKVDDNYLVMNNLKLTF